MIGRQVWSDSALYSPALNIDRGQEVDAIPVARYAVERLMRDIGLAGARLGKRVKTRPQSLARARERRSLVGLQPARLSLAVRRLYPAI